MGFFDFMQEAIAIDLGTANTLIVYNDKVVVDEPSIVAKNVRTGEVIAIGKRAQQMHGKAHRDIKKDQLINSINKKQTMVEVEFQTGGQDFKIIRGIRPGKFEIWQNGNMINQSSNARDYQKFLEQNILKLNHKSFHLYQ